MEITPELPDGYEGSVHRRQCKKCHQYFLVESSYFYSCNPLYCHSCSMLSFSSVEELWQTAETSLHQSDFDVAELAYDQAIQSEPHNPQTYKQKALFFLSRSRKEDAIKVYEECIRMNPDLPDGYYFLFLHFFQEHEYQRCISVVDKYLEHKPHDKDAVKWRIHFLILLKDERTEEALNIAIAQFQDPSFYFMKGTFLFRKKSDEAIDSLKQGLALCPDEDTHREQLIRLLYEKKRYEEVLDFMPRNIPPEMFYLYAETLYQLKKYERAKKACLKALKFSSTFQAIMLLGDILTALGDFEAANRQYTLASQTSQDDLEKLVALASKVH